MTSALVTETWSWTRRWSSEHDERQLSIKDDKTYPGGQLWGPVVIYSSLVMCWPIVSWNPTLAIPKISGAKSARFDICPIRVVSAELEYVGPVPAAGIQDTESGWWPVKVVRDWVTSPILPAQDDASHQPHTCQHISPIIITQQNFPSSSHITKYSRFLSFYFHYAMQIQLILKYTEYSGFRWPVIILSSNYPCATKHPIQSKFGHGQWQFIFRFVWF